MTSGNKETPSNTTDVTEPTESSQENEKNTSGEDVNGKPDELCELRKKSAAILKYLDKHPHR